MEERRKYMRFSITSDVIYRVLGKLGGVSGKARSEMVNVCRNGLCMSGQKVLAKGEIVELEMMLPGEVIPVIAFGEVVWSRMDNDYVCRSGMRFTQIDGGDRSKLIDYAYRTLTT